MLKSFCITILAVSLTIGFPINQIVPPPSANADLEVYKIPQGYYDSTCQKPIYLTFYDWLGTLPIPPYEANGCDCSQMGAYIEWLSENCGYNATIVGKSFEGYGHIWVMIDIDGVPFAYEPTRTGYRWVPRTGANSTHFHYDPDIEWDSIYEAPWAHSYFDQEYAWWITYPSLVTAKEHRR